MTLGPVRVMGAGVVALPCAVEVSSFLRISILCYFSVNCTVYSHIVLYSLHKAIYDT